MVVCVNNCRYCCNGLMFVHLSQSSDINECGSNATNNCSQTCLNHPGSYECACETGYSLASDERTCEGTSSSDQKTALLRGVERGGDAESGGGKGIVNNVMTCL